MSESALLEVRDLYKSFSLSRKQRAQRHLSSDRLVAVNGLSLSLYEGEIYGLLGPNGAGKTTTLRMIATLLSPERGEILYRGNSIGQNELRKKIGFLTSELKLDDFFTPSYTFDYFSALYGIDNAERDRRKGNIFARFGVDRFADTQIKNLSTGMKQKVSLAISIAHNPEIIVYDEPTNGLDIMASRDVENFLLDLKKEGKAIVISTHIFSLVEKLCDTVGIILDGSMRLEGKMNEVCANASLEQVFFDLVEGQE
ncbi:MAG: ABC transporter ATP-binding protein [Bacilli bacterium]|nr:ABC transporter ATP-binding protein [Bacilli bacterium]